MRQIWIFFAPGVGGDGLANLLEQCGDVHIWAHDSTQPVWRVHRVVDDQVKFWAPAVDQQHCFRNGRSFELASNQLAEAYVQALSIDKTIVVTSHDILLYNLYRSDCQDLFTRNQIRILLDSRDYRRCLLDLVRKNLMILPAAKLQKDADHAALHAQFQRYQQVDRSRYDHVVWAEDLLDSVELLRFINLLKLDITRDMIDQYRMLRYDQWRRVLAPDQNPPRYRSYVESGEIRYELLTDPLVDQ
jgi:hypothetical protein